MYYQLHIYFKNVLSGSNACVFFFECVSVDCVSQEIVINSSASSTCNDVSNIIINTEKSSNSALMKKSFRSSTKCVIEKGKNRNFVIN